MQRNEPTLRGIFAVATCILATPALADEQQHVSYKARSPLTDLSAKPPGTCSIDICDV
jgi:hypothetical protein